MAQTPSPFRTAEQRSRDRQAKKLALMEAAVRMFNTRGFHATSLDDVAASLGVTKPTVYHYLGNKESVLLECLRFGLKQLLDAATAATNSFVSRSGAVRSARTARQFSDPPTQRVFESDRLTPTRAA